jgi:hypothetical protein
VLPNVPVPYASSYCETARRRTVWTSLVSWPPSTTLVPKWLQRSSCGEPVELHCLPALDVEIEYHLQRVGPEVGERFVEEFARDGEEPLDH